MGAAYLKQMPPHRRLGHNAANDLNVLAMSLEALPLVRDDPGKFADAVTLMRVHMESLKDDIADLVDLAGAAPVSE
ncbi:hypothetical protein OAS39_11075 [Pirellulales bacterium]|nr:hypothetical protein [Pirellulales bacterium]